MGGHSAFSDRLEPFFDDLAGVDDGRIHQPGDDAVCGRLFSRPP
ncbi:MAG: hypothetical protein ACLRH2_12500 [Faecalibacterium prausnitzii]